MTRQERGKWGKNGHLRVIVIRRKIHHDHPTIPVCFTIVCFLVNNRSCNFLSLVASLSPREPRGEAVEKSARDVKISYVINMPGKNIPGSRNSED